MDFRQAFLNALKTNTQLTKSVSLLDYLPKFIITSGTVKDNLPYVQAYGNLCCSYPYHYMISGLDSYCLLYTENGSGTLTLNKQCRLLAAGTLAFINCREPHRLEIKNSSWNYRVIFINGKPLSFFHDTIKGMGTVTNLPLYSAVPEMIKKLFFYLDKNAPNPFLFSKLIFDILFEIILESKRLTDMKSLVPDYLMLIKNDFDLHYHNKYTLDFLEQRHHVSKYRICREFSRYFDSSPILYLNRRRITAAKKALIQTDKRINEIGQTVGFDNTNHFIRLFKQHTGVTPLEFRKQTPAGHFFI